MSSLIGQQLGNYEVISLLGKGGMATVYRARQTNIKRDVAVKVIKSDLAESGDFTRRFEREAETIAALDHPHIIKLFDYGQHGDMVYLVMQLLRGGSLAELIRKGPLPLDTASLILEQVSSALEYAHVRDIIHRDLKPQNVLLDENGNAFLTDFGIARLVTQTTALTQSGVAVGTPAYMAPEQWQSRFYDARADIYALGIVLYEMLTGRLPFDGETPARLMYLHLQEAPPPISLLRPDIPPGVEGVMMKALAKRPDERFQSAVELSQAFKAALGGQTPIHMSLAPTPPSARGSTPPSLARPTPTRIELTQSPARSNRSTLLGIAVVALVLLLIGGAAAVMLGGRGGVTPSPTLSGAVILLPTVPTSTSTGEGISKTDTPLPMITATPSITPNQEDTINAIVNNKLTASAVKSATPSATSQPTTVPPTTTSSPTSTRSPIPTDTAVPLPSLTPTASETAKATASTGAATPAGTPIAMAILTSPISPSNADQVSELARLEDPKGNVTDSVAFSPDGALLASADDDYLVRLWDLRSGQVLAALQAHTSRVTSVAFSPDGALLASGGADKTVILWDMKTKTLRAKLTDHTEAVTSLGFSPDGSLLAAGSADKSIIIWDVKAGTVKGTLTGHTDTVNSVSFSPDGALLASGGQDKTVNVWDVKAGTIQATLSGPTSPVSDVAFSPDGTTLVSGSPGTDRNAVWTWQIKSGQVQTQGDAVTGLLEFAGGLGFNPDGTLLAYGDTQSKLRLWDMGAAKGLAALPGHTDAITSLVFSHSGSLIATSSADKTIRLWGLASAVLTSTPAVTPIPCTVMTDKADTVPIRVGPGKSRGLRDYMQANQSYQVIGQAQSSDGSAWWKLKTDDGSEAWVAQSDAKASGDCGQIGVVPTPQVQRPRPSNTPVRPGAGSTPGGSGGNQPPSQPTAPPGQPTYTPLPCGNQGQTCCGGSNCNGGLTCQGGVCNPPPSCGGQGQACCGGSNCNSGLSCQGGVCNPTSSCGNQGESCCAGGNCNGGLTCQGGVCNPPQPTTPPCQGSGSFCTSGSQCCSGGCVANKCTLEP